MNADIHKPSANGIMMRQVEKYCRKERLFSVTMS